jgi:[ribosomal protein S5]-alanine N-acetyltransferase
MFPVELPGVRVLLREVVPQDLEGAFDMVSDPEWSAWLALEPIESRAAEADALAEMMALARETPRVQYHLIVTLAATGEMLGMCRIGVTNGRHRAADIGYGIRRPFWRQGLATETAGLLIAFGFGTLRMHRVWATHHPENVASARVLEKVGMTRDGRIRDHLLAHGAWRDSITWSILEDEWRNTPMRGAR